MSDLSLEWGVYTADLTISANDFVQDDGLQTAITLSLFTDRRSDQISDLDQRGWWGDSVATVDGDQFGSRLWLLGRAKMNDETLILAEEYAREALQWLIDDLVSPQVDVSCEWVRAGILGISVTVHRPTEGVVQWTFNKTWAAQEAV
jgi:phage gp46-like protein